METASYVAEIYWFNAHASTTFPVLGGGRSALKRRPLAHQQRTRGSRVEGRRCRPPALHTLASLRLENRARACRPDPGFPQAVPDGPREGHERLPVPEAGREMVRGQARR